MKRARGVVGIVLVMLTGAMVLGTAGCLPKTQPQTVVTAAGVEVNARELRMRLYAMTARMGGAIEAAMEEIYDRAEEREVRRHALNFRVEVIPALHRAAFRPDPLLSVVDVWLFTIQLRMYLDEGEGKEMFGAYQPIAQEAVHWMETEFNAFLDRQGRTQGEPGGRIEEYAREHPLTGSISSRSTAITPLAEYLRRSKMGAFAAVGSLVESIDDMSDRMAIYAEQLPRQARWHAETVMFDRGIEELDIDGITADLARLGVAADRLNLFIDEVPALVDEQIEGVIPKIEAAVESVDLDPAVQRVDALIAAHLAVALDAVTRERIAALEAVSLEREAATQDAEQLANDVVDRSFLRVEEMLDSRLARLMPLGIVVLLVPFALGLIAGLLLRRR